MLCFRWLAFLLISSSLYLFTHGDFQTHNFKMQLESGPVVDGVVMGRMRRSMAEENATTEPLNSTNLILAAKRTHRRDPLADFKRYTGGWNISEKHYWASVGFTAAPLFAIALVWFALFGLSLLFSCCYYCCCSRAPYGYSRTAYALSLILLILFTVAAIVGCIVLYTAQGQFHESTSDTLEYVVKQANVTVENLRNVSSYLDAAQQVGVARFFLPSDAQSNIDNLQKKMNDSASTLSVKTEKNSQNIQDVLDTVRLILILVAAVMLGLAFLGFLLSIFGLQVVVYILVVVGWILVAGTFILCGVFLLLHNVTADTCVAMDQWVQYPTAHTALDDILPCVDNATAQATLLESKQVTSQLVDVVNRVITNLSNSDFPTLVGLPVNYNQSGPKMPILCNPFNSDMTNRTCSNGEVDLNNATEVWKNYICNASAAGICTTVGRLTPDYYKQMSAAVNVSFGLYHYTPFLVQLQDCTFARDTFRVISNDYCPDLRLHSERIYIGLVMVSAAVMLSLIFWVLYARERRHRVYTKHMDHAYGQGPPGEGNKGY